MDGEIGREREIENMGMMVKWRLMMMTTQSLMREREGDTDRERERERERERRWEGEQRGIAPDL